MFHPRCMYPARTGTHTCVQRERFSARAVIIFLPAIPGPIIHFPPLPTRKGQQRQEVEAGRKEGRGLLESSARLSLGQLLRAAIYGSGIAYLSIATCMYAAK